MHTFDESTAAFVCEECGNIGLGTGEIRCCGESMDRLTPETRSARDQADTASPVTQPTLDTLLGTVFDMSDTELELCLCVMEGGELTVSRLADDTGYDRSVVSRHLNHLVNLSVVRKQRRLLERGGEVYVYTPADPETVRTALKRQFLGWVADAAVLLDELRREKVEAIAERHVDTPTWRVYQRPSE